MPSTAYTTRWLVRRLHGKQSFYAPESMSSKHHEQSGDRECAALSDHINVETIQTTPHLSCSADWYESLLLMPLNATKWYDEINFYLYSIPRAQTTLEPLIPFPVPYSKLEIMLQQSSVRGGLRLRAFSSHHLLAVVPLQSLQVPLSYAPFRGIGPGNPHSDLSPS